MSLPLPGCPMLCSKFYMKQPCEIPPASLFNPNVRAPYRDAAHESTAYLLFRVGDVIVHHHDDLLVGNPIAVDDLVGVACICLGDMISASLRFCPEGGQVWSSNEQHVLSPGRHAVSRSLLVRSLNYFRTYTFIFLHPIFKNLTPPHYPSSYSSGS